MQPIGSARFDFVRFFVIFLAWIIGAWAIIYNINKIEREEMFFFDRELGIERQEKVFNVQNEAEADGEIIEEAE